MTTFRARKSGSDMMMGRASTALNTALFQSDFPLLIQPPPKKKIKMYFMKLLYMKHLLAIIKWTI